MSINQRASQKDLFSASRHKFQTIKHNNQQHRITSSTTTTINMRTNSIPFSFLLLAFVVNAEQEEMINVRETGLSDFVVDTISHPCLENGVVSGWCDASIHPHLQCTIHPSLNMYTCQCSGDPSACPSECVKDGEIVKKMHYGIQCQGIPEDEPNYILRASDTTHLPLHHCENNARVANWCNEGSGDGVNCLLLPALDEYVCNCHGNTKACPQDCVGGVEPDKKTKYGIRCKGIPLDQPNYVLTK